MGLMAWEGLYVFTFGYVVNKLLTFKAKDLTINTKVKDSKFVLEDTSRQQ